jgi:hypothetical protein
MSRRVVLGERGCRVLRRARAALGGIGTSWGRYPTSNGTRTARVVALRGTWARAVIRESRLQNWLKTHSSGFA